MDTIVTAWIAALEKRHTATLTFQEVRKGVQALSSLYVERRGQIAAGAAFHGAGKCAGFAMFYAPLHFLLVREIVRALHASPPESIIDLGCGTGCAGAAWAIECGGSPQITGIDRNSWAIKECKWNYRELKLQGTTRTGDVALLTIPPNHAIVAAFTINELSDDARARLLKQLLDAAKAGQPVLVVEPIARRLTTWWEFWSNSFRAAGGRDDDWRFPIDLPDSLKRMDRAAGLDHRELTARSLWLSGR